MAESAGNSDIGEVFTAAVVIHHIGHELEDRGVSSAQIKIEVAVVIEVAEGDVFATRADGTRVALGIGDSVFQGDVLETAGNGTVGLVFVDDTTFSLGGGGRMEFPSCLEGHRIIAVRRQC